MNQIPDLHFFHIKDTFGRETAIKRIRQERIESIYSDNAAGR